MDAARERSGGRPDRPGPDRWLLLIGGLPGAGKTTLLRRILATAGPDLQGVDSEQVTARLRAAGVRVPYRVLRPVVHTWHRVRVRRALHGPVPVVVVTDPATSARRRRALLRAARRGGRRVRLLLIDVSPAEAVHGQATRSRTIGARSMRRHVRRWDALRTAASAPTGLPGVDRTVVVGRDATGAWDLASPVAVVVLRPPAAPR